MKYLKKLFLLCLVCLFGSLMFINAFADEVNNQKLIELKRYNPEDYPPISISAPTYHNLYPMSFDHGYSAVMVGYFEDVEIVKYSDNLIITDDGIASNDYDYLNLSSTLGVNISDLASAGVVTLGIDFRVMLHEIDDGYQYFYLYDGSNTQLAASAAHSHQYGNNPRIYQFYAEIELSSLTSDTIYFRFNASGAWSDDWQCDYIDVNVLVSRGSKLYSGIKYCGEVSSLSSNY